MTMVPHWSGPATVTDTIDGDGARRLVQTGGERHSPAADSMDVNFATQTLGTAGTVASTLEASGVAAPKRKFDPTAQEPDRDRRAQLLGPVGPLV